MHDTVWCLSPTVPNAAEPMNAFYSDRFVLPLPLGHRFPMDKYRLLRERVAAELPSVRLNEPEAVADGELALAHAPDYIDRISNGRLSAAEVRAIGFPWSEQMVQRSRRSTGPSHGCRSPAATPVTTADSSSRT